MAAKAATVALCFNVTTASTKKWMASLLLLLVIIATITRDAFNDLNQEIYGYDVSWAVKSKIVAWSHVQGLYDDFIDDCRVAAGPEKAKSICEDSEDFRLQMNTDQPISMRNYTRLGFKKIKAPAEMFRSIREFWERNRQNNDTEWYSINTYHNMWHAPPTIVNIQLPASGGGPELTQKVWESSRLALEEWTGMHLSPCSIWGIRIYHNDSIITTHVDQNPLVTSAIINIDQDVDEPWPLEVWGHDGKPYNITMEPGDMLMYESHSVLHGRPFPMHGRYAANVFVHFEPLGSFQKDPDDFSSEVEYQEEALDSLEEGLPPYVIPGSPWEAQWWKQNPDGWKLLHHDMTRGVTNDDMRKVDNLYIQDPDSIYALDANGWSLLHEVARAGHVEMAQYLCARGLDVSDKTGDGSEKGETAADVALKHHGEDSAIYQFLKYVGRAGSAQWRKNRPDGWRKLVHSDLKRGVTTNDLHKVNSLYIQDRDSIHAVDANGWSALHETARAGHVEMAQYLIARGLDSSVENSEGESAAALASKHHGAESAIYKFLVKTLLVMEL